MCSFDAAPQSSDQTSVDHHEALSHRICKSADRKDKWVFMFCITSICTVSKGLTTDLIPIISSLTPHLQTFHLG